MGNDIVRALGPRKFIEDGKCMFKGGFAVQTSDIPEILKMQNLDELRSHANCPMFFRPYRGLRVERLQFKDRGCSLRRRFFVCVEN